MLTFHISDILTVPFGAVMRLLYNFTGNYGISVMLFAAVVQIFLYPVSLKTRYNSMKLNRLEPQVQKFREQYADDLEARDNAILDLYKKEKVSKSGGVFGALLPIVILLILWPIVTNPMVYLLNESSERITIMWDALSKAAPEVFPANAANHQMLLAGHIAEYKDVVLAVLPDASQRTLQGVNFLFLGIDLSNGPFAEFTLHPSAPDLTVLIIPVLTILFNQLTPYLSCKMLNVPYTRKKLTGKSGILKLVSFLITLWVAFRLPGALTLYILARSILSLFIGVFLTKKIQRRLNAEMNREPV